MELAAAAGLVDAPAHLRQVVQRGLGLLRAAGGVEGRNERVVVYASEVALGIDRVFSPAARDEPFEEQSGGPVVRWLRQVA